jgi:tetratricopeptide (TPR) repeat protein
LSDLEEAQAHYREGRLAESERIYQELIDRSESAPAALYGLALIRISQGDDPAAAQLLQRALECERAPNTLYYLGEIAERRGDRTGAIASYGEALARIAAIGGASAQPPVAQQAQPTAEPPAPQDEERPPRDPQPGATVGRVRQLKQQAASWRGKPAAQMVWTFRLESWDPSSGPGQIAAVEIRGNEIRGSLADGDWVEITDRPKDGGFQPKEIINLTTGERVRAKRYWLTSN